MFFNSTEKLFQSQGEEENLQVLYYIASTHFPSVIAYNFFKTLYTSNDMENTANEMFLNVNNTLMRSRVEDIIILLFKCMIVFTRLIIYYRHTSFVQMHIVLYHFYCKRIDE